MSSMLTILDCNEKSYCVFCYRTQNKDGKSQSSADLSLFLVMIQRYFGIPVKLNKLLELDNISEHGENILLPMVPCETCSSIVSSFNELYHEMKCTELRIQMKMRSLMDVMEFAGKVSSRKRPLKKLFGEYQFRKLATNRENWKKFCSTRLENLPPTLTLEDMSLSKLASSEVLQTQDSIDPVTAYNFNLIQGEAFIHWIISAILLGCLLVDHLSDVFQGNIKLDPGASELEPVERSDNEHADVKPRKTLIVVKEADTSLCNWDGSNDLNEHVMDRLVDTDFSMDGCRLTRSDLDPGQTSGFEEIVNELTSGSAETVQNSFQMELSHEENMEVASINEGSNYESFLMIDSDGNMAEKEHTYKAEIKPQIPDQKKSPREEEETQKTEPSRKQLKRVKMTKTFVCNICNKRFLSYNFLSRHKKRSVVHLLHVRLSKSKPQSTIPTASSITSPSTEVQSHSGKIAGTPAPEIEADTDAPTVSLEMSPSELPAETIPVAIPTETTPPKEITETIPSASIEAILSPETSARTSTPENPTGLSFSKVSPAMLNPVIPIKTPRQLKTSRKKSPQKASKPKRFRSKTASNARRETPPLDTSISVEPLYNLRRRHREPVQKQDSVPESRSESGSEDDFTCTSDYDDNTSDSSEVPEEVVGMNHTPRKRVRSKPREGFSCKICTFHTVVKISYDFHLKLHEPGDFQCSICEEKATSALELCHHELTHGKKPSSGLYKCSRCAYSSKFQTAYTLHFAQEHLNITGYSTKITCQICNVDISHVHRETHFRKCHNTEGIATEKIITCPDENCKAYFINTNGFRRHRAVVHAWKDLYSGETDPNADLAEVVENVGMKCKICQTTYHSELHFRRHCNQYHNSDETSLKLNRKFICSVRTCAARFKTKDSLDLHSNLHGSFNCANCSFQSNFVVDLMKHEINCRNLKLSNGFKCPNCTFCSKSSTDMIDHRLEVHKGLKWRLFECEVCSARFLSEKDRYIHFNSSHGKKTRSESVPCDNCPAYFLNKNQLAKHLKTCSGIESEKERAFCRMCEEQFKNAKEFEIHSHFHGKWNCQFCQVVNEFAPDLANHEVENHSRKCGNKVYCSRCKWSCIENTRGAVSFVKHFLTRHLNLNTKVYQCNLCAEGFFLKASVKTHDIKCHRGITDDQFKCDLCQGIFPTRLRLWFHKRSAHEETEFLCDKCEKKFKSRNLLRDHRRRMHDLSDNKYACDQSDCGRSYGTELELILHRRQCRDLVLKKAKSKKVVCEICGKSCRGEQGLKLHRYFHTADRPTEWKCGICNKTFKEKYHLKHHEEFHKGPTQWKFMCEVCSKKCVTKASLTGHMRTHTKEKPFVCQVCGGKYAHRHNLHNHIKSKHKEVQLEAKTIMYRPGVSRKGKKLGKNFCFTREKDLEEEATNDS